MTVESLARAIHEDQITATRKVRDGGVCILRGLSSELSIDFDKMPQWCRDIRMEQARLLFKRIMR